MTQIWNSWKRQTSCWYRKLTPFFYTNESRSTFFSKCGHNNIFMNYRQLKAFRSLSSVSRFVFFSWRQSCLCSLSRKRYHLHVTIIWDTQHQKTCMQWRYVRTGLQVGGYVWCLRPTLTIAMFCSTVNAAGMRLTLQERHGWSSINNPQLCRRNSIIIPTRQRLQSS